MRRKIQNGSPFIHVKDFRALPTFLGFLQLGISCITCLKHASCNIANRVALSAVRLIWFKMQLILNKKHSGIKIRWFEGQLLSKFDEGSQNVKTKGPNGP